MAWCWRSTAAPLEVERHVGMAIEADRNASHLTCLSAKSGPQKMKVCCSRSGETLRTKQHEASMALLIRHFVTSIILVGDALGVWCGLV